MNDLGAWFEALNTLEKIYWVIAFPASIAFVIQLIMAFVGGDLSDDVPDVDIETDGGIGFQFFTLRNLIAFFTIFSWTGIACLDSQMGNTATIIVSLLAGGAMVFIMAILMHYIGKLKHSGTLNMANAVNKTGEVYLRIPAARSGFGKVQINLQGSLRELEALTDESEDIPTGAVITVLSVVDERILIVKKNKQLNSNNHD
jgi:hypothetical protein